MNLSFPCPGEGILLPVEGDALLMDYLAKYEVNQSGNPPLLKFLCKGGMGASKAAHGRAPESAAMSPLLFVLYTSDGQTRFKSRFIIKFADDSVIVSLLPQTSPGLFLQMVS